jgi:hypothetical protein
VNKNEIYRGRLCKLDHTGHTVVPAVDQEITVEEAEVQFNEWIKEGHTAFVQHGPNQGRKLTTFDPLEEEVIFSPALRGG